MNTFRSRLLPGLPLRSVPPDPAEDAPTHPGPRRRSLLAVGPIAALLGYCACSSGGPKPRDVRPPAPSPPAASAPAAGAPAAKRPIFRDVSAEVGIEFTHFNGMSGEFYFCEVVGPGAALFDADGDGDLDAYLVQGAMLGPGKTLDDALLKPAGPLGDRLYLNQLAESGVLRFVDATDRANLGPGGYGMGVAAGDLDNDGDVDLHLTRFGPDKLLLNRGDGTFEDATSRLGTVNERWSTSAAFVDYDRDGWLDLYVGYYVDFGYTSHKACYSANTSRDYCGPLSYTALADVLLRNRGDGTFEDVSNESRITREFGGTLGVVAADFDGDNWPDLYVANDGLPNQLWLNDRNGTFTNAALVGGCAVNADGTAEASMGVDAADFDGDGDIDLFMTHLDSETNTLYLNDGKAHFVDASQKSGLGLPSRTYTGFGTAWIDYDNDGWLDLFVANGAVRMQAERTPDNPLPLQQKNQLFRNMGDGRFSDVTSQGGEVFDLLEIGRGAAFGDVDDDGDADVLLMNNAGPARLLLNQVGSDASWLGLRLVNAETKRDQHGASVHLLTADGRWIRRHVRPDGSYLSANDPRVLIGLGASTGVRMVGVQWPSGWKEQWPMEGLPVNRYLTLVERTGRKMP